MFVARTQDAMGDATRKPPSLDEHALMSTHTPIALTLSVRHPQPVTCSEPNTHSRHYMFAALADVGRHVGTLVAAARGDATGTQLLALAKIVAAHTTLLQGLRDTSAEARWSAQLADRVNVRRFACAHSLSVCVCLLPAAAAEGMRVNAASNIRTRRPASSQASVLCALDACFALRSRCSLSTTALWQQPLLPTSLCSLTRL